VEGTNRCGNAAADMEKNERVFFVTAVSIFEMAGRRDAVGLSPATWSEKSRKKKGLRRSPTHVLGWGELVEKKAGLFPDGDQMSGGEGKKNKHRGRKAGFMTGGRGD